MKVLKRGLIGMGLIAAVCCVCIVVISILPSKTSATPTVAPVAMLTLPSAWTSTLTFTQIFTSTNTLAITRTKTPTQLTSTITQTLPPAPTEPQAIFPGTYLIGTDIQPGLYVGFGGESMVESCYWARLKDVTGALDSILANDNSVGQFYVQVKPTDYALETKCRLLYLKDPPKPVKEFPTIILPGMYLVGIDIKPGMYRGEGGVDVLDSCYWARLRDAYGDLYSIIANDNANGQFYLQIFKTDFALTTRCKLDWVK